MEQSLVSRAVTTGRRLALTWRAERAGEISETINTRAPRNRLQLAKSLGLVLDESPVSPIVSS